MGVNAIKTLRSDEDEMIGVAGSGAVADAVLWFLSHICCVVVSSPTLLFSYTSFMHLTEALWV